MNRRLLQILFHRIRHLLDPQSKSLTEVQDMARRRLISARDRATFELFWGWIQIHHTGKYGQWQGEVLRNHGEQFLTRRINRFRYACGFPPLY